MNDYESKLEAKRERLLNAAERAQADSQAAFKRADLSHIPMGQPVLVGHHSEGRHRRDLARADAAMGRSVERSRDAEELQRRAEAVGTGGISQDDPEAVHKLKEELAGLEKQHELDKANNKIVNAALKRVTKSPGTPPESWAKSELEALGCTFLDIAKLFIPDFCGRYGIPDYVIKNRSANMARIRKRIETLSARNEAVATGVLVTTSREVAGVTITDNVEANRLQLTFPGKPSDTVRAALKSYGFRWTPSEGVWQSFRSSRANYNAQQVLALVQKEKGGEP